MFFTMSEIIELLQYYKYFLLFPIAVVEGPIVSILGGFLAASGYLNIYAVYACVVLGDLVGDNIYYYLGKTGRESFVKKYGKYIGISEEAVKRLTEHFTHHAGKTLLIGKFLHSMGTIVLISAGIGKMNYRKFFLYNIFSTLLKSLILVLVGYYFGRAYDQINHYFNVTGVALLIAAAFLISTYLISKRLSKKLF